MSDKFNEWESAALETVRRNMPVNYAVNKFYFFMYRLERFVGSKPDGFFPEFIAFKVPIQK
jgi:hypothetical protein